VEVLNVRIVEEQEVPPARVVALVEDHVEARRRAQIALVELAALPVQPEDRGKAPHALAPAVEVERPAGLPDDDHVRLALGPGDVIVVVGESGRGRGRNVDGGRMEAVERIAGRKPDRHHHSRHHPARCLPHETPAWIVREHVSDCKKIPSSARLQTRNPCVFWVPHSDGR
jgi:hypothetical protein